MNQHTTNVKTPTAESHRPASVAAFKPENLGRATYELQLAAGQDESRIEQLNKAYLYLHKSHWHVEGNTLVVESATKVNTLTYRVTAGRCQCTGFITRGHCWHADAYAIVLASMALAGKPVARQPRPMAEVQADADEIFA